jgi:cytoskeletal protein CcmA (bactofilin family)
VEYSARRLRILLVCSFFLLTLSTASVASANHDRTQVGSNISIGPNEESGEATCFGCSIRVRGHVMGDVTTFGGSIVIEDGGQVDGDATAFAGSMRLNGPVSVSGDVAVFGGQLRRDSAASIGGDTTNMGGPSAMILIVVLPLFFLGAMAALVIWIIRRLLRPSVRVTAQQF